MYIKTHSWNTCNTGSVSLYRDWKITDQKESSISKILSTKYDK